MGPRTETRDRLIEAAMQLFFVQSYQATGLSQTARRAGALRAGWAAALEGLKALLEAKS